MDFKEPDVNKESNILTQDVVESSSVSSKSKKSIKLLYIIIPILLFLVAGLLLYFFFFSSESSEDVSTSPELEVPEDKSLPSDLTGQIYLTLRPTGVEQFNVYEFDVSSQTLSPYLPLEEGTSNLMGKFSPDGSKMVFSRGNESGEVQLLIFDKLTEEISELTSAEDHLLKSAPRNPVFSSDGSMVVYWIYELGGEDLKTYEEKPEDFGIYLVSLDEGVPSKLTNGAFPIFYSGTDSEMILFLKDDGLYTLSIDNIEEERLVMDFSTYFEEIDDFLAEADYDFWSWLNFRFALSQDSDSLIITDSFSDQVYKFSVMDWSSFELFWDSIIGPIHGALWPVFSPGGDYLAMQRFSSEKDNVGQLHVLDINTLDDYISFDLDDYVTEGSIWITDWVK